MNLAGGSSRRGEAADGVADLRVVAAADDEREVVGEVGAGDQGQDREDLLGLDLLEEGADQRVGHALVDEVDVEEARGVGDDRVAAVQDADLHVLERGDVGHELDAGLLEGRAAGGKRSSTTHWMKSSQNTGQASSMPNSSRAIVRSRSPVAGGDAVDHAVREGDGLADPGGEGGVLGLGEAGDGVAGDDAVVRDVVAGEHGEGRAAGGAAGAQAGEDQAEDGLGVVGVRASATMAEWSGSKAPVAGSMK